jgi:tripartite-type tricarboxylate transporter receptor subunit TctC
MNTSRRYHLIALAAALAGMAWPAMSQAAAGYPSRPVTLVLPTPAGGPSDVAARLVARSLSAAWGQAVNIENKPGAGGAIAARAVMSAQPDGYTLLWGISAMAGLPFVQKSPPYRSLAELAPVANVLQFGYALFVNRDLPVQNFAELVAYGRANPDQLNYGTGVLTEYGAAVHVLGSMGIRAQRVPYKGGVQVMPDLISGQVQLNFGPIGSGLQHVRAGKLKVLATALSHRSPILPDVPTFAELGVPPGGLPSWNAVFAPASTPREVIDTIARAVAIATRDPAVRGPLVDSGSEMLGDGPDQLAQAVESATQTWKAFVRDNQIPLEGWPCPEPLRNRPTPVWCSTSWLAGAARRCMRP